MRRVLFLTADDGEKGLGRSVKEWNKLRWGLPQKKSAMTLGTRIIAINCWRRLGRSLLHEIEQFCKKVRNEERIRKDERPNNHLFSTNFDFLRRFQSEDTGYSVSNHISPPGAIKPSNLPAVSWRSLRRQNHLQQRKKSPGNWKKQPLLALYSLDS